MSDPTGQRPFPPIVRLPPPILIDDTMRKIIEDARLLLEYAISEATPRLLGLGQVDIIKPIADIAYPTTETHVTPGQWVAFLSAYERLCTQTSPGTASSLRNTNVDTF